MVRVRQGASLGSGPRRIRIDRRALGHRQVGITAHHLLSREPAWIVVDHEPVELMTWRERSDLECEFAFELARLAGLQVYLFLYGAREAALGLVRETQREARDRVCGQVRHLHHDPAVGHLGACEGRQQAVLDLPIASVGERKRADNSQGECQQQWPPKRFADQSSLRAPSARPAAFDRAIIPGFTASIRPVCQTSGPPTGGLERRTARGTRSNVRKCRPADWSPTTDTAIAARWRSRWTHRPRWWSRNVTARSVR